ncbi:DUF1549 domain-containing protein [Planctomycetales bacterium ZRK34]|nr:DUF1549 domain-containing protein [Planctomycetales bacterium ZRK34]
MILCALGATSAFADDAKLAGMKFFEQKVRPVLAEHCYKCHGPDKHKADLRVDGLDTILRGGKSGPVIVPGEPNQSLLIQAVRHDHADLKMPKDGDKLPDAKIDALIKWVKMGAPWPGAEPGKRGDMFTAEDRAWWAIQPVNKPAVPKVNDQGWSRNAIDPFVFRKLSENKLSPAGEAGRVALIRRVSFDLIGLPPTPEQIDAFVKDTSADAYEKVVDRLLASPHYGERWARHWLDLVRYADSDGYRADGFRPDIWRYRDYVVRSFNQDKPYDQFVTEQLAGDEVAPEDPDALIATGYMRLGVYEWNQRDCYTQQNIMLDDMTAVTSDVFLGLSMECAHCHNHKFDPILQKDYYRLRAFFEPVIWRDDVAPVTPQRRKEYEAKLAEWEQKTQEIRDQIAEIEAPYRAKATKNMLDYFTEELQAMWRKPAEERTPYEEQLAYLIDRQVVDAVDKALRRIKGENKEKLDALGEQLKEFDKLKPAPLPPAMTASDVGVQAPPTRIEGDRTKRVIEPGFLSLLDPEPAEIATLEGRDDTTGRRTTLARWITNPDNPLTARVLVNRIWQQHFGRGIVATPSEFGKLGEPPTHPELLDYLASTFIENGWSIKKLHRLIVTSATYRQTADRPTNEHARRVDPANTLLWRMNTRRLDSEQARDAMIAAAGELDDKFGGPTVSGGTPRRSIYVRVKRLNPDPVLAAFDAPSGLNSESTRNVTTTARQALLMINGDWPLKRAKTLARTVRSAHPGDPAAQVDMAYRLTTGRVAETHERESAIAFLQSQAEVIADREAAPPTFGLKPFPERKTTAAMFRNGAMEDRFHLKDSKPLPTGDFTIEAYVKLDSLYPDASVRAIVSQWDADSQAPGWLLGVTSEKSRYTPRNLIVQFVGDAKGDRRIYEVLASGLHLELNRPYYVAFSIDIDDTTPAGITFYLKDLSDPDSPTQVAHVPHQAIGHYHSDRPLTIGGRHGRLNAGWDGLIDEVRLTASVLPEAQLLINSEAEVPQTVGHWKFETNAVLQDSSAHGNHLQPGPKIDHSNADEAALVDFCQLLLNSSEFLYLQ